MSFSKRNVPNLVLFARRPEIITQWLKNMKLSGRYTVADFTSFTVDEHFDAVINFVGSGNPAQLAEMGASIFDVTLKFDTMVLDYLHRHPDCRYLFLSSGAAYGSNFDDPVDEDSKAVVAINNLKPQDWYAVAKLYAECRHRALPLLPIVDIRVFNYFSHTQDISARFFISDILRAIRSGETLITSPDNIVRDYIGPDEFFQLISLILAANASNDVIDCYTKAPVNKMTLLSKIKERFSLNYEIKDSPSGVNATGLKMNYFSKNRRAESFGYLPTRTALDCVLDEAQLAIDKYA